MKNLNQIKLMETRIFETFDERDLINLDQSTKDLINQCNLETDFTGYTSFKVAFVLIALFRTQKEFDELVDSFDYLDVHDVIQTIELSHKVFDEQSNDLIKMFTSNPRTSQLLQKHLWFDFKSLETYHSLKLHEFASPQFKKWFSSIQNKSH